MSRKVIGAGPKAPYCRPFDNSPKPKPQIREWFREFSGFEKSRRFTCLVSDFFEMQTKRGAIGLWLSEFRFVFGVVDEFVS